jgi:hypothetical protein
MQMIARNPHLLVSLGAAVFDPFGLVQVYASTKIVQAGVHHAQYS